MNPSFRIPALKHRRLLATIPIAVLLLLVGIVPLRPQAPEPAPNTEEPDGANPGGEAQNTSPETGENDPDSDPTLLDKDLYESKPVIVEGDRRGRTGMKQDLPPREIPATVNVIDAEDLQSRAADEWIPALAYTPGIFAHQNYGGFNTMTMRGLDSRNVLLLRNGARDDTFLLVNSSPMSNMVGVERIEILKGPNSVLYGQGALAGAINIISKAPERTPGYEFSATGGSFGTRRLAVGATGPIGTDALRYRVDAGASKTDGWRENGNELKSGAATIEWDLGRNHTLTFFGATSYDVYETDAGLPRANNTFIPGTGEALSTNYLIEPGVFRDNNYNTDDDYLRYRSSQFRVQLDSRFADFLKMRAFIAHMPQYYDYFAVESLSISSDQDRTIERDHFHFETKRRPIQGTMEFEWGFDTFGIDHRLLTGYEFHEVVDNRRRRFFPGGTSSVDLYNPEIDPILPLPQNFTAATRLYQKMHSGYFQDIIELHTKFKLVLGGRYDHWLRETRSDTLFDLDDSVTQAYGQSDRSYAKEITSRAAAVYEPVEWYQVYAGYSTAFNPVTVIDINRNKLRPETGEQTEIGQRIEFADGKAAINSALFVARKSDVVVQIQNTPPLHDQAGKLYTQGYEISAEVHPIEDWTIEAGYAHTDAEWKSFVSTDSKGTILDFTGKRPINVPQDTFSLWTQYRFDFGLGMGIGGRYVSEIEGDNANSFELPAYGVYDALLFYEWEQLRFQLNWSNFTNKEYFVSSIPNPTPGPPAQVFFTVSGKF
ncbi:MAG: TonB-dependent receptor [bacterium]|nr:TonB-dependent receptor [bacterium]